jgi:redox-sensitive bicupin YhaK (pirin superfamily)
MSNIERIIEPHSRDLGDGFTVRRVLPFALRRHVGPFVFFDHFGPVALPAGTGLDVRPHPHIGLATVTYLFEGGIVHRDCLGFEQPIAPGDVNWMIAGRGIVHSERSSAEDRVLGPKMHGIQSWVALPDGDEEMDPSFHHHPKTTIPEWQIGGVTLRLVAGTAYGYESPAPVRSPTLYAEARFGEGAELAITDEHEERAVYVVSGNLACGGAPIAEGTMAVLKPGGSLTLRAEGTAHVMLVGGAPMKTERYMDWNFVSSSKSRIDQAKRDWKEGRFAKVPGDDKEWIPLPS